MPSYARRHQLQQSLVYHIYNRGNLKLEIFHSDQDYLHFLKLVKEYSLSFAAEIYHWAIMPNHFHLLLEIDEPERLSAMMAGLARAYAYYYHAVYQTAGFLWQGRFQSRPIEKEHYLINCGRYIERNPVRANIVTNAKEYPYSSARFYCQDAADGITTEDPAFRAFGESRRQRQYAYTEFLKNFDPQEDEVFENLESPLGSQEFIRRLSKINGRYLPRRKGRIQNISCVTH